MTNAFESLTPIEPRTVATFRDRVPPQIVALWNTTGVGRTPDGFVRVLDPARALQMTAGVVPFPEDVVPVFSTALADLICWWPSQNAFVVWKFRWGVIDALGGPDQTSQLIELLADDAFCDQLLDRQPYPAAATRSGIPGPDQCYGFVPLLALGGPNDPGHLDLCGMWEHISLIHQLAGPARPRRR